MELIVGDEVDLIIESALESGMTIEVKLPDHKGRIVSEYVFMQEGTFIATSGGYIYHYHGETAFSDRGTCSLLIDGEKKAIQKLIINKIAPRY